MHSTCLYLSSDCGFCCRLEASILIIAVPGGDYTVTFCCRIGTHNTLLIAEAGKKVLVECCGTYRDGYAQLHLRVFVFMLLTCVCVHAAYVRLCSCCVRVLVFMLHAYVHDSVNIVYRDFYLSLLVTHLCHKSVAQTREH